MILLDLKFGKEGAGAVMGGGSSGGGGESRSAVLRLMRQVSNSRFKIRRAQVIQMGEESRDTNKKISAPLIYSKLIT